MAGARLGWYPPELALVGGQGGGARARGGRCKGFGSGGVGGRDTGPRTEQISQRVSNAYKKKKNGVF